jgi:hypothetical protein
VVRRVPHVGEEAAVSRNKLGFTMHCIPVCLTLFSLWFDEPYDPLMVVSKVERLTILSIVKGQLIELATLGVVAHLR